MNRKQDRNRKRGPARNNKNYCLTCGRRIRQGQVLCQACEKIKENPDFARGKLAILDIGSFSFDDGG